MNNNVTEMQNIMGKAMQSMQRAGVTGMRELRQRTNLALANLEVSIRVETNHMTLRECSIKYMGRPATNAKGDLIGSLHRQMGSILARRAIEDGLKLDEDYIRTEGSQALRYRNDWLCKIMEPKYARIRKTEKLKASGKDTVPKRSDGKLVIRMGYR